MWGAIDGKNSTEVQWLMSTKSHINGLKLRAIKMINQQNISTKWETPRSSECKK